MSTELSANGLYMKVNADRNKIYDILNSIMNLKQSDNLTKTNALNCWYYIFANKDWKNNDSLMILNIILMHKVINRYVHFDGKVDEYNSLESNFNDLFSYLFSDLDNNYDWFNEQLSKITSKKYKKMNVKDAIKDAIKNLYMNNIKNLYLNNQIVIADVPEDKDKIEEIDVKNLYSSHKLKNKIKGEKERKMQDFIQQINNMSFDEVNKLYSEMFNKKASGEQIDEEEYQALKDRYDKLYNENLEKDKQEKELKDISEDERNKILAIANEYSQTNDLSKYSDNDLEIYLDLANKIINLYQGTDKNNLQKLIDGIKNYLQDKQNEQTINNNIKSDDDTNFVSDDFNSLPVNKTTQSTTFISTNLQSNQIKQAPIDNKQAPENKELNQLQQEEEQINLQQQEIEQSNLYEDEKEEQIEKLEEEKKEIKNRKQLLEERRNKIINKYLQANIISRYDTNDNFIINGTNIILNKNDLYNILHRRELDEALRGVVKLEHEKERKREEINKALVRKIEQNMLRNKTLSTNKNNMTSNYLSFRHINPLLLKHSY